MTAGLGFRRKEGQDGGITRDKWEGWQDVRTLLWMLKQTNFPLHFLRTKKLAIELFWFNSKLYEHIDGVAMGSPLGPLMANTFLCSIKEKLEQGSKLPDFYRKYVDDTLAMIRDVPAAEAFLSTLNELSSIHKSHHGTSI